MSPFHLPQTELTPLVVFEPKGSILKIEGRVIPGDVESFFAPINKWIDDHIKGHGELHVLFRLYYFNTSSFKRLLNMCIKFNTYFKQGKKISVRWEYLMDDETGKTDAEELLERAEFPYEIVSVEE